MSDSLTNIKIRTLISLGIILAAMGLAYIPIPQRQQNIVVVSGTELQEPLKELATIFESKYQDIDVELKFQGSQDMVNNFIDRKNDFTPTILIPANGAKLSELRDRYAAQSQENPFYSQPQPISKTMVVAVAWPERGDILFPDGRFQWSQIERAMQQRDWGTIGGDRNWGSFDFLASDPTRSNSGQLTMSLWARSVLNNQNLNNNSFNNPQIVALFALAKRSIYQPPRSTDTLLENFITLGPNNADVATVYESIALYRWSQARTSQGKAYKIYYLEPTVQSEATAAILRRDVDKASAEAARQFLDFLRSSEQQKIFVKYGFRPAVAGIDLKSAANSPWQENIPGAKIAPPQAIDPPSNQIIAEIQRLWQRSN